MKIQLASSHWNWPHIEFIAAAYCLLFVLLAWLHGHWSMRAVDWAGGGSDGRGGLPPGPDGMVAVNLKVMKRDALSILLSVAHWWGCIFPCC